MPHSSDNVTGVKRKAALLNDKKEFENTLTLEMLRKKQAEFSKERDWDQFHTPRNLLLALVGEVGELSEIFQWRGEVKPGLPDWKEKDKIHLGEELSDVLVYLVRLSDRCGIDLATAVIDKMKRNAAKYPADLAKGSSNKYTAYTEQVKKNKKTKH